MVGWFGVIGPAVASMSIAMDVRDDQNATLAGTVFMSLFGASVAALAIATFAPLVRARGR